ncbi:DUF4383 domain-containing protein [Actinosynnema sp. NPDC047251]|uniref:DUF4383 domain-containing protein n=1 Tax=Saccharothrix espanaensis (strain ATCC 51144 / DSM 44229 / JCM 9112 / NBRC 15066 / NRRL 15764) TaxID=1179773 RepID=K0KAT6_SACES|nr:DUF4383 domain-containing protein [Saccharothrix espanaensis]CCH33733.1 hypothetical protein BN6_64910 [Saccharothrix espanaensis DSM 44229]
MTHSTIGRVKVAGLQPAQVLAGLLGLAFLVAGVAGFVRTGFGDFTGDQHAMLFGFAVNPLHNVVHLAFGVLGLLMATGSGLARLYGWIVFLVYGVVLVWGLMLVGVVATNPVERIGNPLALNVNDNWLHLGIAAVGLLIAVLPARRKIVTPEEPEVEPVAERDESIRDPEMPVQRDREPLHPHDQRIEAVDPTVSPRPTQPVEAADPPVSARPAQPIDPAVAEQHKARHYR